MTTSRPCTLFLVLALSLPCCNAQEKVPYKGGALDPALLQEISKVRPFLVATPAEISLGKGEWGDRTITILCAGSSVTLTDVRAGWWIDANADGSFDEGEIDPTHPLANRIKVVGTDCVSPANPAGTLLPHGATCTIHVTTSSPESGPILGGVELRTAAGMVLVIPVSRGP